MPREPEPRRRTLCLAASPGGHIAELQAARQAFAGYARAWVTGASAQADALREAGEQVHLLPLWGRDTDSLRGLVPNLRLSWRLVRRVRPGVVITNGAGLVAPFALMARLAGADLIVIETMARVTKLSLTGRILAPFARTLVVQWSEMRERYPRAIVCRPALLEQRPRDTDQHEGTLVSVGTRPEPFDRLLAMVDDAVAAGRLPPPVVAQSGASRYRPRNYSASASLAPAEIDRAMHSARYVVCHGGTGLIAAAIAAGRRPLVLARRRALGEHRTEHQHQIVEKLAGEGAIVALDEQISEREVQLADEPPPAVLASSVPSLASTLREHLDGALA